MVLLEAWKVPRYALIGILVIGVALAWPIVQLGSVEIWFATLTSVFPNNVLYPIFAFFAGTYTILYLYQRNRQRTCPVVPKRAGSAASLIGVVIGFCPACIPAVFFFLPLSVTIALGHWSWVILLGALAFILYSVYRMEGFSRTSGEPKQQLFECKECGFLYREKKWAEKCAQWCRKYKSCNLEIAAHAIHGSQEEV